MLTSSCKCFKSRRLKNSNHARRPTHRREFAGGSTRCARSDPVRTSTRSPGHCSSARRRSFPRSSCRFRSNGDLQLAGPVGRALTEATLMSSVTRLMDPPRLAFAARRRSCREVTTWRPPGLIEQEFSCALFLLVAPPPPFGLIAGAQVPACRRPLPCNQRHPPSGQHQQRGRSCDTDRVAVRVHGRGRHRLHRHAATGRPPTDARGCSAPDELTGYLANVIDLSGRTATAWWSTTRWSWPIVELDGFPTTSTWR